MAAARHKNHSFGDAPGHATCHPFVQKWTLPLGAKRGDDGGISADRFSEVKPARGLRRGLGGGGERARRESACGRRQRTSIPRGGDGTGWGGARTVFPDWVVSAPSSPACCGTATEGRQRQTWATHDHPSPTLGPGGPQYPCLLPPTHRGARRSISGRTNCGTIDLPLFGEARP